MQKEFIEEQNNKWEYSIIEDKYIRIDKCISNKMYITIPNIIEEKQVVYIGDRVFEEMRNLISVIIPDSVVSLGKLVFYNCVKLKNISLSNKVTQTGDGILKNCSDLSELNINAISENEICLEYILHNILSETQNCILVNIKYGDDKYIKLHFPSYVYEYVENHPARVFHHEIYGTGYVYRECVTKKGIDFAEYDKVFKKVVVDDCNMAVKIAFDRMMYNYKLSSDAEEMYRRYLEDAGDVVLGVLVKDEDNEKISWLADRCMIKEEFLDEALDVANKVGNVEAVSLIMDYRERYFGGRKVVFEL